eukprot:scaffold27385_cov47-Attheya_sp.AAC.5
MTSHLTAAIYPRVFRARWCMGFFTNGGAEELSLAVSGRIANPSGDRQRIAYASTDIAFFFLYELFEIKIVYLTIRLSPVALRCLPF